MGLLRPGFLNSPVPVLKKRSWVRSEVSFGKLPSESILNKRCLHACSMGLFPQASFQPACPCQWNWSDKVLSLGTLGRSRLRDWADSPYIKVTYGVWRKGVLLTNKFTYSYTPSVETVWSRPGLRRFLIATMEFQVWSARLTRTNSKHWGGSPA